MSVNDPKKGLIMGNEWTQLKINSIEELSERVSKVLGVVGKDERYRQSIGIL